MAEQDDGESKSHEPSQRRLDEARRKGDIPRSADLTMAIGYGGVLLAAAAAGSGIVDRLGTLGAVLIGQADTLAPLLFGAHGAAPAAGILRETGLALAPLVLVPIALVILGLLAQRGFVFAPDKLVPKLERVSLVQNARQKFGLSGLVEFAKSFVKLCVYSLALGLYVAHALDDIALSATLAPAAAAWLIGRLAVEFLAIVVALSLAIGLVDAVWQHADHRRRNRMSHKELRDEQKDVEGDPHLKERRRQRGLEIAQNRMLDEVPGANVVIVNPTHYAVALSWSRTSPGAPVCVAKGQDAVAARIREVAQEAGVPVHEDPPTARALYATVGIGEEIGRDHYAQVAAAIRFAEAVRARARRSPL